MVTTLFPHFPDEVALSWFIRYRVISGDRNLKDTSKDLFGVNDYNPNILYATHLRFFCNQIPSELKIDPEYVINNMTVFPFFKPFLPLERANSVQKGMLDDSRSVLAEMGINAGNAFLKEGRIIKVCKVCLKSDEQDYGMSYLHRVHQVPGNLMCIKHKTPLSYFSVKNDVSNYDISIDSLYNDELPVFNIKQNIIDYFTSLGEDIEFVASGGLSDFSADTVRERYSQRLQEKGYILVPHGRIKQRSLIADFKRFYPVDFLESFESNFDDSYRLNWFSKMFIDNSNFTHPIRQLFFIRFLFGSAREFRDYNWEYKPFGNSPYPCLNPIAHHYMQDVIQSCELKRNYLRGILVGVFKCDCGFTYSRPGPDKTEGDRNRCGKVMQYGHVWENKFKELVDRSSNISFIAKELKCERHIVIKYATFFGIADKLNTEKRIFTKKTEKRIGDSGLDVYKEAIIRYIIDNPGATRTLIKKALTRQFVLLLNRDRQWLDENLPKPDKKNVLIRNTDWKSKDEELLQKIEQIVSQLMIEEKPRRITITLIADKIGYRGIAENKIIRNLPKTEKYLLSCCETSEDFRKRKNERHIDFTITNIVSKL